MRKILFIYIIVWLIPFTVHSQESSELIELKLKSKVPLGEEGRLYLPKKRQALIFNKDSTEVWNIETGKLLKTLPPIITKQFFKELSPDETKFVAYGFRKTAEVWEIRTGKLISTIPPQKNSISKVEWSSDNRFFILKANSFEPKKENPIWDGTTGKIKSLISTKYKSFAQFSPDGKTILTTENFIAYRSKDHIKLWGAASGDFIKEFLLPRNFQYVSAYFAPNGKDIIVRANDKIFFFDIATREIRHTINNDSVFWRIEFSPDKKFLLLKKEKFRGLLKEDATWFEIYDLETGALKVELKTEHPGKDQVEIYQIVWRPDGKALISAGERYQKKYGAESWDISTGRQKFVLSPLIAKQYINPLESGYKKLDVISYTSDSKFLITTNSEFIRIWDAETGKFLQKFNAIEGRFFFNSDHKYLGKIDEKEKTISFYEITKK